MIKVVFNHSTVMGVYENDDPALKELREKHGGDRRYMFYDPNGPSTSAIIRFGGKR